MIVRLSSTRRLGSTRLAWRIVKLNFRAQLEYRGEFLLMIAVGAIWQVSIIVFATVLLGRFSAMADWPSDAVLLIAAMRMLSHGLYVLVYGRVWHLGSLVQRGLIDGYLLRPMPVYRQVQLAEFPTNAIGDLLVGVSLCTAALWRVDLVWSPLHIVFLAAAVIGGMLMESAIGTALSSAVLHYPASRYWHSWVEELLAAFGNYPLKVLPGFVQGLFTLVLPLAFVSYFPAAVLTGNTDGLGVPLGLAVASPAVGLAAFIGSRLLWNHSLRRYTGVNG